jgi:heptosyltransferase-3
LKITKILIWHQGALGDLLLAGPALIAISRYYSTAQITALGHPERWGLLANSLPLDEIWNSGEGIWAPLFGEGVLPAGVKERLARFQLALIFSPRPQPTLKDRMRQAGIPIVHCLPSFPEKGTEAVADLQARHLAELGLHYMPGPFKLVLGDEMDEEPVELPGAGPWLAVAPGSGQARKNWTLAHYYEVSRTLAWKFGLKVVWLAGPAEEAILPYIEALAHAQGHFSLANLPLVRVARVLSHCRLYIGNDSGLTHLAAAVTGPDVIALFGPTDPRVWAPIGPQLHAMTAPCSQAPCAAGRNIPCLESVCLEALSPEEVLATAVQLLSIQDRQVSVRIN